MQTSMQYCAFCGYKIYDQQETTIDVMSNVGGAQTRHATWQGCQYSIDRGDGWEIDAVSIRNRERGRRSGYLTT